jgi:predicted nucleotidyltransferase
MDKGYVIEALRRHELELRDAGIMHLRLFGSVARGEATTQSDVDLLADIDRSKGLTLFGMAHLENRLSDILGTRVDLTPAGSMKERVRVRALSEAIDAF